MNLADVKAGGVPYKKRKRVGRGTGSGSGKTCGRGHKGARSRSGWKSKPFHEGGQMPLSRRLPQKGFNNFRYRKEYAIVNIGLLDQFFEDGATIGPEEMRAAGVLRGGPRVERVKVLGEGLVKKKLIVQAHKFSGKARDQIVAAGGEAREITA
ncbi:MAG: 50S ribosomal protein L15 [Planctomycetota bacterium]|jgi:large subunit ribosomal protein L15|nr:50S ribosomal protein L15 [Planctomycetota bacterium]